MSSGHSHVKLAIEFRPRTNTFLCFEDCSSVFQRWFKFFKKINKKMIFWRVGGYKDYCGYFVDTFLRVITKLDYILALLLWIRGPLIRIKVENRIFSSN